MKFVTKVPLVFVEAFKITEQSRETNKDWPMWLDKAWQLPRLTIGSVYVSDPSNLDDRSISIATKDGYFKIYWNTWIVKQRDGTLNIMDNPEFEETYKPLTDEQDFEARLEELEDIRNIQCAEGTWNSDAYMHGMANGLILALHIMKGMQGECGFYTVPMSGYSHEDSVLVPKSSLSPVEVPSLPI